MYLLSLRLLPIFPFFLINLVMGVTKMRVFTFFFVSQLGMLGATIIYVNAGEKMSQIESLKDIFSSSIVLAFTLLGLLPFLSRRVLGILKNL